MKRIIAKIKWLRLFLTKKLWMIPINKLQGKNKIFIKTLRIILISIKGFNEDKLQLKASGLTFYSLLSIVPAMAMGFGIAKGFGLEKILENQLRESFENQQEILEQTIEFANSYLSTTKGGFIAGIGLVILFWTIIKLFMNIEEAFNGIWKVEGSRNYARKFTDYFALMLIAPVLLILSSSVTVFVSQFIRNATEAVYLLNYFSPLIFFGLRLVPYFIIWVLLTFLYRILPNTKVKILPSIIAGVFAGTIYQIIQWVYIFFQVGVSKYNAIYGSFAALPLFLIWLQLSWLIILVGAKISYAVQNSEKYEYTTNLDQLSFSFNKIISIYICEKIVKNFKEGLPPINIDNIADKLVLPHHIVNHIVNKLIECDLISEVKNSVNENEPAYQPALDIHQISIRFIIERLENYGINDIHIGETPAMKNIHLKLTEINNNISKIPTSDILLMNL